MNADEGSEREEEETNSSQTQVVVISISQFTLCHSKLSLSLWYRHDSSGVCSSMWGSSTGSVSSQTVLSPETSR